MSKRERIELQLSYLLRQIDKDSRKEVLWNELLKLIKKDDTAINWVLDAFGKFIESRRKK